MNSQNSYFNDIYGNFGVLTPKCYGASSMNRIDPKEFPFSVCSRDFKTRAEAEQFAKKRSGEIGDDVIISQRVAIVKFPVPDLKVEELVVS